MNNSIERLFAGMVTALRSDVVPRLEDEYAAGQALAIVDLLQNLAVRVDWAVAPLREKSRAQVNLLSALDALLEGREGYAVSPLPNTDVSTGFELSVACDAMDSRLATIVRWLGSSNADQPCQEARALLRAHLKLDLERDLSLTPRPLFAEISRGRDSTPTPSEARLPC